MVTFIKLDRDSDGKIVQVDAKNINQSDIQKCPHCIFMAEHYRDDGSCKCDDPSDPFMKEWGYTWDEKNHQWS